MRTLGSTWLVLVLVVFPVLGGCDCSDDDSGTDAGGVDGSVPDGGSVDGGNVDGNFDAGIVEVMCAPIGDTCGGNDDCCSMNCMGGMCAANPISMCSPLGESCTAGDTCCSTRCADPAGAACAGGSDCHCAGVAAC